VNFDAIIQLPLNFSLENKIVLTSGNGGSRIINRFCETPSVIEKAGA